MMITTLKDFLEACKEKNTEQIEDIFYTEIDDNTYIQIMANVDDDEAMDPVQSAFNKLGKEHNIRSLIDY